MSERVEFRRVRDRLLEERLLDIEHDLTRRVSALEDELGKAKARIVVLEKKVRVGENTVRSPTGKNLRIVEARRWLLSYLSKRRVESLGDVDIPAYADLAWRVFNQAENAGISRAVLREARLRDEGLVEIRHILRTKRWVWCLTKNGVKTALSEITNRNKSGNKSGNNKSSKSGKG